jgi:hypothetical protein
MSPQTKTKTKTRSLSSSLLLLNDDDDDEARARVEENPKRERERERERCDEWGDRFVFIFGDVQPATPTTRKAKRNEQNAKMCVVRFFKFFGGFSSQETPPSASPRKALAGLQDGPRVVVWFRNLKAVLKVAR